MFKICVIEEAHVILCILPDRQILSGFLAATADCKNCLGKIGISFKLFCKVSVKFRCPLSQQFIYFGGIHTGNYILGNVGQLSIVKQGTGGIQLLGAEFEGIDGCIGIGTAPVLKIGVQDGHQIFLNSLDGEALCLVVGQCQLGVLALAEFTLGVAVHLHQRSDMNIFGQLEAQCLE